MVSIANGAANGPLSGTFAADKSQTLSSQYHKKNLELGCEQTSRGANGFVRDSGVDNKTGLIAKNGYVRHFIAILALSAIVMANMNRQAYNQALVRMIKKPPSSTTTTTKIQEPAARIETEPDVHVTNDTSPPPPDLTNSPPLTVPSEESLMPMFSEPIDSIVDQEVATGDPNSNTNQTQAGPQDSPQQSSTNEKEEEDGFDWTGAQIGTLQAGFSLGYTFFMIPGGRLSEIYGSKWVIFVSGFGSALCSILTPFIASQSYAILVASRVFMGLCQTGVSPALYAFCTRWLAPDESSVYLPMIKVGVMIGFMLGSLINGFLPWRLMFYVVGIAGFLWSLLWACFATSEPREQRYITKSELAYIEQALEQRRAKESPNSVKSSSAPWWNLMTNSVVLAFTFTKFTVKMSTDAQTMQLPMYMRNVFQVSDSLNGILNGANFAIQACFTGLVAYVAKEMVARKAFKLNKTGVRCLFQGINNFGMGLGYLLISFNMGSLELVCCAVMILSISSMFGSGGEAVLPVDLTTEYAASIMAIANSMANLSGIILPKVVALLLGNQLTSTERWNHVLWFLSSTLICGGLVFCFFVKAKVQDFSVGNRTRREASEKKVNKPLNPQIVVDLEPASQTTRL